MQHQQTLNGQNQVNLTIAMMLQSDIPFSMEPTGVKHRWVMSVPVEAKEIVQKFAMIAGDVTIPGLTVPNNGD